MKYPFIINSVGKAKKKWKFIIFVKGRQIRATTVSDAIKVWESDALAIT